MNQTIIYRPQDHAAPSKSSLSADDPRVLQAMEEYLAAQKAGQAPNRADFLAQHADITPALAVCLDGLEFIQVAAQQLSQGNPTVSASNSDELHPEQPLGDFRIRKEIGRGGMGVVYEAIQISLGRRVALKVLPFASTLDSRQLQRFKNEAQAAAHLHHTNIVPVFATGVERGVHFYAMQFIEGHSLAEMIADLGLRIADCKKTPSDVDSIRNPQSEIRNPTLQALTTQRTNNAPAFFRTVAELGIQAAEALEYAHQMGIVHRDIKPANLMVSGGPVADSRQPIAVWITDFGLAQFQTDTKLTMTGDFVGTLRYMSPEQALAKRGIVDHRTDIYSLGITLYELLTLQPAFDGKDRQEVLRQIAFEEPKAPRKIDRGIPAELETIVLKAMEKDPEARYATAGEVAADLRRWVLHEPIRAKQPSLWQRGRKWARRHVTTVLWILLLLLIISIGAGCLLVLTRVQNAELDRKNSELDRKNTDLQQALQIAQRSRQLAHRIIEDMVSANSLSLMEAQRELLPSQKEFLQKMAGYYQQLAAEAAHDETTRAQRGNAFARSADIQARLGQKPGAMTAYSQAVHAFEGLVIDFPEIPAYRQELALANSRLASLLRDGGDHVVAEPALAQAIAYWNQLCDVFPNQPQYRHERAKSTLLQSIICRELGRFPEALSFNRQAVAMLKELTAAFPTIPEYRSQQADGYECMTILLRELGDPEARETCQAALQTIDPLLKEFPDNPKYRFQFLYCSMLMGHIHLDQAQDSGAALACYEQARDEGEKLRAFYPGVATYRHNLSCCYLSLGILHHRRSALVLARNNLEAAVTLEEKLMRDEGDQPGGYTREHARVQDFLGAVLRDMGELREARKCCEQALATRIRLFERAPDVSLGRQDLARSYVSLGQLALRENDLFASRAAFARAIELQAPVEAHGRHRVRVGRLLGEAYDGRARVFELLGHYDQALPDWERAVLLIEDSAKRDCERGRSRCLMLRKLQQDQAWPLLWGWPRH